MGAIDITDDWMHVLPSRDRAVAVAVARGLRRRAAEFPDAIAALAAVGLVVERDASDGTVVRLAVDPAVGWHGAKTIRALAAGAEDEDFVIVWDARGGGPSVYRIDFDGRGGYAATCLVFEGGDGYRQLVRLGE